MTQENIRKTYPLLTSFIIVSLPVVDLFERDQPLIQGKYPKYKLPTAVFVSLFYRNRLDFKSRIEEAYFYNIHFDKDDRFIMMTILGMKLFKDDDTIKNTLIKLVEEWKSKNLINTELTGHTIMTHFKEILNKLDHG